MRISDWSSDVCSSDLDRRAVHAPAALIRIVGDAAIGARAALAILDHVGGMVGDNVHIDLDPARVRGVDEAAEIVLGAEMRVHRRSEEHTSELQSLMRISYAVFCLKKKNINVVITGVFFPACSASA